MTDTELIDWQESKASEGSRWFVTDHGLVERASKKGLNQNDIEYAERFKKTLREALHDAVERTKNGGE